MHLKLILRQNNETFRILIQYYSVLTHLTPEKLLNFRVLIFLSFTNLAIKIYFAHDLRDFLKLNQNAYKLSSLFLKEKKQDWLETRHKINPGHCIFPFLVTFLRRKFRRATRFTNISTNGKFPVEIQICTRYFRGFFILLWLSDLFLITLEYNFSNMRLTASPLKVFKYLCRL